MVSVLDASWHAFRWHRRRPFLIIVCCIYIVFLTTKPTISLAGSGNWLPVSLKHHNRRWSRDHLHHLKNDNVWLPHEAYHDQANQVPPSDLTVPGSEAASEGIRIEQSNAREEDRDHSISEQHPRGKLQPDLRLQEANDGHKPNPPAHTSENPISTGKLSTAIPDIIHITFEEAVRDSSLQGWEDEWLVNASYNSAKWGFIEEPKIDFVYLCESLISLQELPLILIGVNGSDEAFQKVKNPYELQSVLNDLDGNWTKSHGVNRYRDWDELRYSVRSVEKHASSFLNKVQIIVNSVDDAGDRQRPDWLREDPATEAVIDVLAQEDFFEAEKQHCLPTFNSLTIENQLFNTPSKSDHFFALSDDMLLGKPHTASDLYSPLLGPVMGFKTNSYSATAPPTDVDAHRFGEKPFLIYTSWLLNRRFGVRKRKGQGHFGHSLSRSVMREALSSFPGPEMDSACERFRGEPGIQIYAWYASFHYLIERHREALLWSYIMLKSDLDGDGHLSQAERDAIVFDLEEGHKNEGHMTFRKRNYYHVAQLLENAGLQPPSVNTESLWTSLDGPQAIQAVDCTDFEINECLGPGFQTSADESKNSPVFTAALVFDRLSRQLPKCGDCLLKLVLLRIPRGLDTLLPDPNTQAQKRELAVKAIMRYQYTIINPDALFTMVTDAEQVDATLTARFVRGKRNYLGNCV